MNTTGDTMTTNTMMTNETTDAVRPMTNDGKAIARELTPAQQRAVQLARQQVMRAYAARRAKQEREAQRSRLWMNEERDEAQAAGGARGTRAVVSSASGERAPVDTEISFRKVLGEVLRSLRTKDGKTLREVSERAGVSLGYLSEVERGQKEASSELLGSITAALDMRLSDLLRLVADRVEAMERAGARSATK